MEYTIDTIVQRLSQPEKIIDPQECNILNSYLNGHITDQEEECWRLRLAASQSLAIMNIDSTAAKAEVLWKISPEYIAWQNQERLVKKLKRYRADLKDRFLVLTNTKRY